MKMGLFLFRLMIDPAVAQDLLVLSFQLLDLPFPFGRDGMTLCLFLVYQLQRAAASSVFRTLAIPMDLEPGCYIVSNTGVE